MLHLFMGHCTMSFSHVLSFKLSGLKLLCTQCSMTAFACVDFIYLTSCSHNCNQLFFFTRCQMLFMYLLVTSVRSRTVFLVMMFFMLCVSVHRNFNHLVTCTAMNTLVSFVCRQKVWITMIQIWPSCSKICWISTHTMQLNTMRQLLTTEFLLCTPGSEIVRCAFSQSCRKSMGSMKATLLGLINLKQYTMSWVCTDACNNFSI